MEDNSIDGIIDQLDVHLMWYNWITKYSPNATEMNNFKKMNKQQKQEYLKEITNDN
tara:strand:- start:2329 stop:2496 length:168 start_codon:yes stop_codon:yes gene_type:complete